MMSGPLYEIDDALGVYLARDLGCRRRGLVLVEVIEVRRRGRGRGRGWGSDNTLSAGDRLLVPSDELGVGSPRPHRRRGSARRRRRVGR